MISSECWNAFEGTQRYDDHPITTAYNWNDSLSTDFVVGSGDHFGVDLCYSQDGYDPPLGLGLYRVEVVKEVSQNTYTAVGSFTMDYRTSAYPEQAKDIRFEYYCDTGILLVPDGTLADTETAWDLSDEISHETDFLQPYPPDNFEITNSNQWNSNPQLSWNFSSEADYWDGFNVYRKEAAGSWLKIAELSMFATSYTDYQTVIQEAGQRISYQVKAVNRTVLSDPTSSISIVGDVYKQGHEDKKLTFQLNQNYPNPFNPTTTISYSIPSDEVVTLRVYDGLGKEVAELINEKQSAGEYSIGFNGESLPSGLYIYKITAGKYSYTRKLMLIK